MKNNKSTQNLLTATADHSHDDKKEVYELLNLWKTIIAFLKSIQTSRPNCFGAKK
jgi:hypothetical protein